MSLLAILVALPISLRALAAACFFLFNPLRRVPGPILNVLFPIWPLYLAATGRLIQRADTAHRKYGPVARWSDRLVSIADPDLARDILAEKDVSKSDSIRGVFQGEVLLNTLDRDFHRKMRRILSPGFSIKYLKGLEPLFQNVILALFSSFEARLDSSGAAEINMWEDMHMFGLEAIGETAFGKTFNMFKGAATLGR
ncbi:cytochrome P450 [Blyttiomyces helicus]|uniref:Cytochrome P450 n=1 Tax=Blyttiomyces helicus TaxID=388810 RepID=A0A4P9W1U2_9FUNG|nr:cytochrome P450 [Blyttiomyces helicus]|eukprot:RKO85133.1 cytochrome P450 [Blyttiomyces helicus]